MDALGNNPLFVRTPGLLWRVFNLRPTEEFSYESKKIHFSDGRRTMSVVCPLLDPDLG